MELQKRRVVAYFLTRAETTKGTAEAWTCVHPDSSRQVIRPAFVQAAVALSFAFCAVTAAGQEPALDPSFGTNVVVTAIGPYPDTVTAVAVQADGKMVAAGHTIGPDIGVGHQTMAALACYNADGSLDATFGVDGVVKVDLVPPLGPDRVYALAIQPDGTILTAGTQADITGMKTATMLNRFDAAGTFLGHTGHNFPDGAAVIPYGIALGADGVIYLAGVAPQGEFAVMKVGADGSFDTSFGSDGVVRTSLTHRQLIQRGTSSSNRTGRSWLPASRISPGLAWRDSKRMDRSTRRSALADTSRRTSNQETIRETASICSRTGRSWSPGQR
jgi:uncharacterized delta-60 repeat protein